MCKDYLTEEDGANTAVNPIVLPDTIDYDVAMTRVRMDLLIGGKPCQIQTANRKV
jgi:hypothetical protein